MPETAVKIDGTKFMWDKETYFSEDDAKENMTKYKNNGFETRLVEETDTYLVYTRRIVTEIVLEEGGALL